MSHKVNIKILIQNLQIGYIFKTHMVEILLTCFNQKHITQKYLNNDIKAGGMFQNKTVYDVYLATKTTRGVLYMPRNMLRDRVIM